MEKKFLLRMSEDKFQTLSELVEKSQSPSLNQYINEVLDDHITRKKGRSSKMEKVVIGEMKVNEVREAVTVTQRKWYMKMLSKYNVFFFSPSKTVTPMMYIYFYGDSSCSPARCISHVGKVSHIYRNVQEDEIRQLPELEVLMADPEFTGEIDSWKKYGTYQIVILSEVEELANPIMLTESYVNHPRIIVNRTSSVVRGFAAHKMDDLFKTTDEGRTDEEDAD